MAGFGTLISWIFGRLGAAEPPKEEAAAAPVANTGFTILVAPVGSDLDGSIAQRLVTALTRPEMSLAAEPMDRTLKAEGDPTLPTVLAATETLARDWLADHNADVLLSAELAGEKHEFLRLRLVSGHSIPEAAFGWSIGQWFDLPRAFETHPAVLLLAVLVTIPTTTHNQRRVVDEIPALLAEIEPLFEALPVGYGALQIAQLRMLTGFAAIRMAERGGSDVWLERAAAAYRFGLEHLPAESLPLMRAGALKSLAAVLHSQGERERAKPTGREKAMALFEEAAQILRTMLPLYGRQTAPLEWSATQASLGSVLMALAKLPGIPSSVLNDAAAAYRASLECLSRERAPARWGAMLNNLGLALQAAAEKDGTTERLTAAVAAYRASLTVRPKDTQPLLWAATQMNLGTAQFLLGKASSKPEPLKAAIDSYSLALEIYTAAQMNGHCDVLKRNIGRVERVLETRSGGGGGGGGTGGGTSTAPAAAPAKEPPKSPPKAPPKAPPARAGGK